MPWALLFPQEMTVKLLRMHGPGKGVKARLERRFPRFPHVLCLRKPAAEPTLGHGRLRAIRILPLFCDSPPRALSPNNHTRWLSSRL